jgi:hypothetical protein
MESEIGLNDTLFCPPRSFAMANTPKRTFKRITERVPFVITCREGKALFQEKENKNKDVELAKLEKKRRKEKIKKDFKITAGKSSIKKG